MPDFDTLRTAPLDTKSARQAPSDLAGRFHSGTRALEHLEIMSCLLRSVFPSETEPPGSVLYRGTWVHRQVPRDQMEGISP